MPKLQQLLFFRIFCKMHKYYNIINLRHFFQNRKNRICVSLPYDRVIVSDFISSIISSITHNWIRDSAFSFYYFLQLHFFLKLCSLSCVDCVNLSCVRTSFQVLQHFYCEIITTYLTS